MLDFFARQDQARRSTTLLIGYFCLAVVLIVLAVYLAARGILLYASTESLRSDSPVGWWDLEWFLWIAGSTAAIILAGTLYQIGQLRQGGRRIAEILDARRVPGGSSDLRERQLLNIVEEMALAAGMPVPEVYVMDRERGINAFAAGFSVNDGIVCVTRGALELLTRDELQGVIAHEFSHLLNGDTLINLRLIGWLHGILLLNQVGSGLLRGLRYGRRGKGAGPFLAIGLALWLLGYLGYLCGQLIKSAVSRQREHLADASAVQYTRNPLGLAGALKKIGGLEQGSLLRHPQAALASHMYFGNGLKESWLDAFATHPSLEERIRRLDPAFNGRFPEVTPLPTPEPQSGYVQRPKTGLTEATLSGAAVMALLERVGTLEEAQVARARQLLQTIPPQLKSATVDPLEAAGLLCALLLDSREDIFALQLQQLQQESGAKLLDNVRALHSQLSAATPEMRLPLVDLLLPALRALSKHQYQQLRRQVKLLSDADQKISLFEYVIQQLVIRSLDRQFRFGSSRRIVQIYAMRGVEQEASLILSLLAHVGHDDPAAVRDSYQSGAKVLAEPGVKFDLLELHDCSRKQLDRALTKLEQCSPQLKRKLLAGCLECLVADGEIKADELELFRALAAALDCPVPPWMTVPDPEQDCLIHRG
jgi:Zn-dependent protease with chaperone function